MSTPTQATAREWRHKLVDGWWCVYDSTGALSVKFIREGDCLNYLSMARLGRIPQHCSTCAGSLTGSGA